MSRQQPLSLRGCEVLPPLETSSTPVAGPAPQKKPKRAGERFRTLNAFCDFTMAGLIPSEIAVWLLLFRDTKQNGLARTSQADLARRAGVNPRTVGRAVLSLCQAGLLSVVHQGGLSKGSSTYRVHPLRKEVQ